MYNRFIYVEFEIQALLVLYNICILKVIKMNCVQKSSDSECT
jgi:hypothetical protein